MNTIICASLLYVGGSVNSVALPAGEAVYAGMDGNGPAVCVLAAVDPRPLPAALMSPRADLVARRFVLVASGQPVEGSATYVASFTYTDGFVWSVFELPQ